MKKSRRGSPFERGRMARLAAVQATYQIMAQDQSSSGVIEEFLTLRFKEEYHVQPNGDLFQTLVRTAEQRKEEISHIIHASLNEDWPYKRLDMVLKAILFIASAELLERPVDIPAPVIITEYVGIAQGFYAGKEVAFINAYLDRLARNLGHKMTRSEEPETLKPEA